MPVCAAGLAAILGVPLRSTHIASTLAAAPRAIIGAHILPGG
jgi:hypothetical protein